MMNPDENILRIAGAAGNIDTIEDAPRADKAPRGIVLVAQPHPLFGGSNTNKVVHTLAKTFARLGYIALRPNFRGVGKSEGVHDFGRGETQDMLTVLDDAAARYGSLPIILAGFSFGAHVQAYVADALLARNTPAARLVLVGTATGQIEGTSRHYETPHVPKNSILIHGADDTTVALSNVLAWAKPQEIPILVVPGADHFFHQRLHILRDIVLRAWGEEI